MDAKVLTQTGLESWMGNGRAGNGTALARRAAQGEVGGVERQFR